MSAPNCPFCNTVMVFEDQLIDTETMQVTGLMWYCPPCHRYLDDADLADIEENGMLQFLLADSLFDLRAVFGFRSDWSDTP